ncbi:SET domain [Trinorchestia longiramus]|nr:SET domain [Trinorchestia longiramus]
MGGHLLLSSCSESSVQAPAVLSDHGSMSSSCSDHKGLSVTGACLPIPWYAAAELPSVQSEHESIHGLSAAVGMAYESSKGRHLVARQDILPGTILAVDQGYGSGVILPSYTSSVCGTCLTYCIAPLPCTSCTMVVFCSEECLERGVGTHHGRECALLPTLRALDMGRNTELALRMVTNHNLDSLKNLLNHCEHDTRTPPSLPSTVGGGAREGKVGSFTDSSLDLNVNKEPSGNFVVETMLKSSLSGSYDSETSNTGTLCYPLDQERKDDKGSPSSELDVRSRNALQVDTGVCLDTSFPSSVLLSGSGAGADGVYGSHDYRSIYHLVGNKTSRTVADLFKRSVMACVVLKLLENSGYFAGTVSSINQKPGLGVCVPELSEETTRCTSGHSLDQVNGNLVQEKHQLSPMSSSINLEAAPSSSPTSNNAAVAKPVTNLSKSDTMNFPLVTDSKNHVSESDLITVGSVLLRHMLNLPCNAHSITLFHLDPLNPLHSHSEEVGANAYGVLSLTNHSCSPNCYRQSYGGVGVLRAIEFIPKGAEISDCYGAHFALDSKSDRQLTLKKQYYFDCSCQACANDWHGISCDCRLCDENYCRDCVPLCKDGICRKSTETLPFKLKCLELGCKGVMNKATNTCSECLQQYDCSSAAVRIILNYRHTRKLTNRTPSDAAAHLHNSSTKQNTSATDDNDNIRSNEAGSRRSYSGTRTKKYISHGSSLKSNDIVESNTTLDLDSKQVSVSEVVDILQELLLDYKTACRGVVEGSMDEGSEGIVVRVVTALSALVVRPSKQLLKVQELLKHCYDRKASHLLLPSVTRTA